MSNVGGSRLTGAQRLVRSVMKGEVIQDQQREGLPRELQRVGLERARLASLCEKNFGANIAVMRHRGAVVRALPSSSLLPAEGERKDSLLSYNEDKGKGKNQRAVVIEGEGKHDENDQQREAGIETLEETEEEEETKREVEKDSYVQELERKLWFSEHLCGELEHLVRAAQRESESWRLKYTEAVKCKARLNRAKTSLSLVHDQQDQAAGELSRVRNLYEASRDRVREQQSFLESTRAELLQEQLAHRDARDAWRKENTELTARIKSLEAQVAELEHHTARNTAWRSRQRERVRDFVERVTEQDAALVKKSSVIKKYRATNPLPMHLISDILSE